MSKTVSIERAKSIMEEGFIGPKELSVISTVRFSVPETIPSIPFSEEELMSKQSDYILILGLSTLSDGRDVTIRNLKSVFGQDPNECEPCFYNQDWYEQEDFINIPMKDTWFLIRKRVYEDSRAVLPQNLSQKYSFPSAINCTYAFFTTWFVLNVKLWYNDFVWCSDTDHNGDRIYIGKYHDIDGVNKNGFSIHRYLSLRQCYGCIDLKR